MKALITVAFFCLFSFSQGLAAEPTFPEDATPKVVTEADFQKFASDVEGKKGQMVKLAGRMIGFDPSQEGTIILAEWLPYPVDLDLEDGPKDYDVDTHLRFAVRYPGETHDPQFKWEGNKFILEGTIQGTRTMVLDLFGTHKKLPYVMARCIHVWETGETEEFDQPDVQFKGPHIARTFCVRK
jgi:hypothetical protein